MLNKKKILVSAAIAGLFAASTLTVPAFADETAPPAGQTGDKHSCKGGACKGEEGAAAATGGEAAAPADHGGETKAKKTKKAKAKKKKKAAPAEGAAEAPAS